MPRRLLVADWRLTIVLRSNGRIRAAFYVFWSSQNEERVDDPSLSSQPISPSHGSLPASPSSDSRSHTPLAASTPSCPPGSLLPPPLVLDRNKFEWQDVNTVDDFLPNLYVFEVYIQKIIMRILQFYTPHSFYHSFPTATTDNLHNQSIKQ